MGRRIRAAGNIRRDRRPWPRIQAIARAKRLPVSTSMAGSRPLFRQSGHSHRAATQQHRPEIRGLSPGHPWMAIFCAIIVARGILMKKLATAIAAIALIGTPAFAADMAVKAPPPPPAPPPISWTGWYGGINVGGTWSDDSINVNTTPNVQCFESACILGTAAAQGSTGVFSGRGAGFIGGGQFGYNWQFNSWVAGFEADIQGTRVKATGESTANIDLGPLGMPTFSLANDLSVTKEIDYLGTVRGRLGWLAAPSLLVYGTGGLAYGGVKASTSVSQVQPSGFTAVGGVPINFGTSLGISQTRTGWTAGGGFEWMFVPRWSVKVEYLYYDLGSVTYNGQEAIVFSPSLGAPVFTNNVQTMTRFNGNIVRGGVNWYFW
jgi:outer membrane immunogenic protein